MFLHLLLVPERIEAGLDEVGVALLPEVHHADVLINHVPPVLVRFAPRLVVGAEDIQTLALGFKNSVLHLRKRNELKLVFSVGRCEHVQSHVVVHFMLVTKPSVQGLVKSAAVRAPDHELELALPQLCKVALFPPNGEGSLDLLADVFALGVPDSLDGFVLVAVDVLREVVAVAPSVPHACKQPAVSEA